MINRRLLTKLSMLVLAGSIVSMPLASYATHHKKVHDEAYCTKRCAKASNNQACMTKCMPKTKAAAGSTAAPEKKADDAASTAAEPAATEPTPAN